MTSRPRVAAGLLAFYGIATLVMMWPFVNLAALGSASYVGDSRLMIWTLAWDNHAVLDHVPLFDANLFYPAVSSLSYNDHLFGISLFTLPIYAATRNPVLAYNLVWLAAPALNALAMHALAWRYARDHVAAVAAAVTFAFSFYVMQHAYGHLSLVWIWLTPLSLVALERWLEVPTLPRALGWGGVLTLQVLSAWYIGTFALLANALLLVWRCAFAVRSQWATRARHLILVVALATAAVWPFAARYQSLARPSAAEVRTYSADWASYVVPPENTLVGRWWLAHVGAGPRSIWGEQTLFAGWIALALAALGVVATMRRDAWRVGGVYLVLLVGAVWLSFGPSVARGVERVSLFGLFAHLPGVAGIRAPARFAMLATLALSILVAHGIGWLRARADDRRSRFALLLLPLMLLESRVVRLPGGQPMPAPIPAIYRSPRLASARALVSLPDYRGQPDWFRGGDYLYYSTAHWRPIVNGFGRAEPSDYAHVISHMNAFPGPNNAKTMRDLGVEYVVLHAARYPDHAVDIVRVARESGEYDLVEQDDDDYLFRVR